MIRVAIVDDHAIVRAGVKALFACEDDIEVVAEASSMQGALDAVEAHGPDVLLLDLTLGRDDGVEVLRSLRARGASTRVLVLSMHGGDEYLRPALSAGAAGYVVKGAGLDDLVVAVRAVASGDRYVDPSVAPALASPVDRGAPTGVDALTPREREVLCRVAEGQTNRQIADALSLSPKTVDAHRTNLMRKLGAHDAQTLTRIAIRHGLLRP